MLEYCCIRPRTGCFIQILKAMMVIKGWHGFMGKLLLPEIFPCTVPNINRQFLTDAKISIKPVNRTTEKVQ